MASIDKIAKFISDEIQIVPTAREFRLLVMDPEGRGQVLGKFKVPEQGDASEIVPVLSNEIDEVAKSFASAQGTMSSFQLRSLISITSSRNPEKRKLDLRKTLTFLLPGTVKQEVMGPDGGVGVGPSEPATQKGELAQLMRHLEAREKTIVSLVDKQTEFALAQNQMLSAQVLSYESRRMAFFQDWEDLNSQKHVRDLENRKTDANLEMKKESLAILVQLLPQFLPGLMELLWGKLGLPPGKAPVFAPPPGSPPDGAPPVPPVEGAPPTEPIVTPPPVTPPSAETSGAPVDKFGALQAGFLGLDGKTREALFKVLKKGDPKKAEEIISLLAG